MKTCLHIFLLSAFLVSCPPVFAQSTQPNAAKVDPTAPHLKKDRNGRYDLTDVKTPDDLKLILVDRVEDVRQNGQIVLQNGRTAVLDNIRIPLPMNDLAITKLRQMIKGSKIGIYVSPNEEPKDYTDKTGNLLGHVMTEKALWVQGLLVSKGYAWADASKTKTNLIYPLYRYEDIARKSQAGLWKLPDYQMKDSATIKATANSYQVFEGVAVVSDLERSAFIKFGAQPGDFGVLITQSAAKDFVDTLPDKNMSVNGQKIRARGWVEMKDNNLIMPITQGEQLELIPEEITTKPAPQQVIQTPEPELDY